MFSQVPLGLQMGGPFPDKGKEEEGGRPPTPHPTGAMGEKRGQGLFFFVCVCWDEHLRGQGWSAAYRRIKADFAA